MVPRIDAKSSTIERAARAAFATTECKAPAAFVTTECTARVALATTECKAPAAFVTTECTARVALATTECKAPAAFATTEHAARSVLTWLFAAAIELAAWVTTIWSRIRVDDGPRAVFAEAAEPFGPYILDEKIGEGGMGVIYKAHHAGRERPAAIKLLPADRAEDGSVERFEREFQLTSKLSHPNTISVYDFGRTPEGSPYYAMEYLEGQDLQKLVDRSGPQPAARVAHLLAQICSALIQAHGRGLLHRDIKPANVFLCDEGDVRDTIKVLDFGLIKEFGQNARAVRDSEIDVVVGTPTYMPPEAVTAPETMDGRSDLYAVGALGYFLLTGAPPFSGKTVLEVCAQHLHSEPLPPSTRARASVPAKLEELILNCLAKTPEARPRDAATLRAALLPLAAAWTREDAEPDSDVTASGDIERAVMCEAA